MFFIPKSDPNTQEKPTLSFKGFSNTTTIEARFISNAHSLEDSFTTADKTTFPLAEPLHQSMIQVIIKGENGEETYANLSKTNNILTAQIEGLNSREKVSFKSNKITQEIPADWAGQLQNDFETENNFCISINDGEICYRPNKGALKS